MSQDSVLMFSPHKAAAPVLPFFSVKGSKTSSRKRHILMRIRHWLLLHLLFPPKVTKRCLRMPHLDKCCHVFCEWPLNGAVLPKKLSLRSFQRKYCTIKDGAQTYDFIADKSCLLFSVILKVLGGWEVIRTQGKCIKSYENFWKDFVVEQNFTCPKGECWSYLNLPYEIVVVWGDRTTRIMDPCVLMILFDLLHYKSTQEQAKRQVFPKVLLFVPRINYDNFYLTLFSLVSWIFVWYTAFPLILYSVNYVK